MTSFTYDPSGNLASLTDPDGNTTSWTYNGQNRMVQQSTSLGSSYYVYNSAGELARYTDADGRATTYQYNSQNELTGETWYNTATDAGGLSQFSSDENGTVPLNTIQYTRDSAGRIMSESDNQSTDTYQYDVRGDIISATETTIGGPTVTLTYQYNTTGERTEMAASIDGTPDFVDDYTYNSLGEVVAVTEHDAGGLSQVSSDETGTVPFNAVAEKEITLAYNSAGQVLTIDRYQDGQLAVEGDYSYDSAGNLIGLGDVLRGRESLIHDLCHNKDTRPP